MSDTKDYDASGGVKIDAYDALKWAASELQKENEKLKEENASLRQRLDRAREVLTKRMKLDCFDYNVPIEDHDWYGIVKELEEDKK